MYFELPDYFRIRSLTAATLFGAARVSKRS
jgi:hypothetical protein